jgi:hypothetical protein
MKSLILAILLIFIPCSSTVSAGYAPAASDFWFCKGVGHLESKPVVFITSVWKDPYGNNYDARENAFSLHLKKITSNKFVPSFTCKCRDYTSKRKALKHILREVQIAERYNFLVVDLNWEYRIDVRKKKGS